MLKLSKFNANSVQICYKPRKYADLLQNYLVGIACPIQSCPYILSHLLSRDTNLFTCISLSFLSCLFISICFSYLRFTSAAHHRVPPHGSYSTLSTYITFTSNSWHLIVAISRHHVCLEIVLWSGVLNYSLYIMLALNRANPLLWSLTLALFLIYFASCFFFLLLFFRFFNACFFVYEYGHRQYCGVSFSYLASLCAINCWEFFCATEQILFFYAKSLFPVSFSSPTMHCCIVLAYHDCSFLTVLNPIWRTIC